VIIKSLRSNKESLMNFSLQDLLVDDCLIAARHIYLKSEEVEKALTIQKALECILKPESGTLPTGVENYSAYTLTLYAYSMCQEIAKDEGLQTHGEDIDFANKFQVCGNILKSLIDELKAK